MHVWALGWVRRVTRQMTKTQAPLAIERKSTDSMSYPAYIGTKDQMLDLLCSVGFLIKPSIFTVPELQIWQG